MKTFAKLQDSRAKTLGEKRGTTVHPYKQTTQIMYRMYVNTYVKPFNFVV